MMMTKKEFEQHAQDIACVIVNAHTNTWCKDEIPHREHLIDAIASSLMKAVEIGSLDWGIRRPTVTSGERQ